VRLIGVVSHGNGAGKTLFIERLLQAHPARFACVKFTTVFKDGQFCPKDAQKRCACSRLHGDAFHVITDAKTIAQDDTDTGRITAAGASPVVWCLARPGAHVEAWQHAREFLREDAEVVTEGNTALEHVRADAIVFLANPSMPRKFWKPNWLPLAHRADAIVINDAPQALGRRAPASDDERRASLREVEEANPEAPRIVARMDEAWDAWAGDLLEQIVAGVRTG
jgi:hypothetical protein